MGLDSRTMMAEHRQREPCAILLLSPPTRDEIRVIAVLLPHFHEKYAVPFSHRAPALPSPGLCHDGMKLGRVQ